MQVLFAQHNGMGKPQTDINYPLQAEEAEEEYRARLARVKGRLAAADAAAETPPPAPGANS